MENAIIESIEKLYRGQILNTVLYFALIIVVVLVTIFVLKFKLLNSKWKNTALISFTVLLSVILPILQMIEVYPIYMDYSEQSYVVVENANVIIGKGSTGGLNNTTNVLIYDGNTEIDLTMRVDYSLNMGGEYAGKIAYTKNSKYLVWYEFD